MEVHRDSIPLLAEVGKVDLPNLHNLLQDVEESKLLDVACIECPLEEDMIHKSLLMCELCVDILEGESTFLESDEQDYGLVWHHHRPKTM